MKFVEIVKSILDLMPAVLQEGRPSGRDPYEGMDFDAMIKNSRPMPRTHQLRQFLRSLERDELRRIVLFIWLGRDRRPTLGFNSQLENDPQDVTIDMIMQSLLSLDKNLMEAVHLASRLGIDLESYEKKPYLGQLRVGE